MRKHTTIVYKFNELSKEAKEKALQSLWDINIQECWWDWSGLLDIYQDDWVEKYNLKDLLFTYKQIYFDLDQNSFLQFKDLRVSDEKIFFLALGIPEKYHDYISYTFVNSNSRWNTPNTEIKFEVCSYPEAVYDSKNESCMYNYECFLFSSYLNKAEEVFGDWVSRAWSDLQKEFNYLTSEENIINNGYEFTIDGKLI